MMEAKKHILVVDDDADIRELLTEVLAQNGYEVTAVEDGIGAMMLLKKCVPDLIILDVMMPVIDGTRLVEVIRAADNPEMWQVPILICSASEKIEEILNSPEFNFAPEDCLRKPFEIADLLRRVAERVACT
jgi:CheY-like chemotaxis protein|uniref:Two-component response regulator n=1 Tax=Chloracidobacterium thermophilum TaxID=458033 RepID=A8DJL8_9BACT|nr:two-component response regulator [Chloracidobacterium thermophilum]